MRRPAGSEAIRARIEVLLINSFQYHADRSLRHLVFEGRDAKRPLRTVRFGYVHPAYRRSFVAAGSNASKKTYQVSFKVGFVFRSDDSVDAGRTTLAGQPIGFPHPFLIDDVAQRVQRHTRPVPRQFRYLLPFRVQVCRVQCPLPCCPSTVLFCDVSLLSAGSLRSGSPTSPILRRRYAILLCILVAYGFASSSRASLPRFVYRSRAPVGPEAVLSGQGHFDAGVPHSGFPARTAQDFSGSQALHPVPLPCSKTPAGSRRTSPIAVPSMLPPHPTKRRLQR
jgi:hypothetical protein